MISAFPQPTDPDAPSTLHAVRVTWRQVAAVWGGGTVGCALRAGIDLLWPAGAGFPTAILLVNLAGAFVLGVLLEMLLLGGDDSGTRRRLRLTLGTGLLGGFTTYSTFALGTVELVRGGAPGTAAAYAAITVVIGSLLAWLGIRLARVIGGRAR